ncbi:GGDEF domain-containing protein [Pseudoalteromonas marina]|jgi:diguanylate cyclase (GGDEF)-like protein|uniref:GGDEF domain-containing protein n=2 Tax=Gammaproteobacteria TaxID=1236 RepID=UPI0023F25B0B|nr:GGDEF domain-containing protein [Pseudoalteromonas marina]
MEKRSGKERQSDLTAHLTGILLLDIDFFKRINDNYGHNAGDAVLIEVSQRLKSCCRDHDFIVRWGGEEIVLLLDTISISQVRPFIQRILKAVAEPAIQFEQHLIDVSVSGGFIHLPFAKVSEQQLNWEKVMQIADMALYLSKTNGRNQVYLVNDLKVPYEQAESLLYSDLGRAIEQELVEITIEYGPGGRVN